MMCMRCGGEKVRVLRTMRNRNERLRFDPHRDVRVYVCSECGLVFYTEMRVTKVLREGREMDYEEWKQRYMDR